MHFKSNYRQDNTLQITYQEKEVQEVNNTKFLRLGLDNYITWKTHIGIILTKLSRVCYITRSLHFLNDLSTIKTIYYAYFHAIMEYGTIFWELLTE
jgi:hypothetical protein